MSYNIKAVVIRKHFAGKTGMLMSLFGKIKRGQTERVLEKYGDEVGSLYIKLWKQRTLRSAVAAEVSDFQAHLVEVMLDRFDEQVEKKYTVEFLMGFKRFIAETDVEKLCKEQGMAALVRDSVTLITGLAAEQRTSVQQETYSYFTQNYDI